MTNKRHKRIGVICHPAAPVDAFNTVDSGLDPQDIYFGPLLRGIDEVVAGKDVEVIYTGLFPCEYLSYVQEDQIDGLVLLSFTLTDTEALNQLALLDVPYIAIGGSPGHDRRDLPCVDASNRQAGRMAAEHLIGLGHRRLGCVNLAANFTNHADRMQGFQESVMAAGIDLDFELYLTDIGYAWTDFVPKIEDWIRPLLYQSTLPTAIFACDYLMADAVMTGLANLGIAVPNRMSVVGFDDPPTAALMKPPLTAIRQPVEAMGRLAIHRLLKALDDPTRSKLAPETQYLPTELIIRRSTAPPRAT